jgi:hypothetical protein
MNENLKEKIVESESSINEIAALLEKDFSADGVIAFFKSKEVEFSVGEAEEFLSLMRGAKVSAGSELLSDDALVGVSGGVKDILDETGEVIEYGRYLACKAAPFIAGCPRIIKLFESRGF